MGAVHLPADQAAELVLRELKRAVRAELEMLEIRCDDVTVASRHDAWTAIRHQLIDAAQRIDALRRKAQPAEANAAERAIDHLRQALAELIDAE